MWKNGLDHKEAKEEVETLAAGAGVTLAGKLAGRGLHFIGLVVLARLLGTSAFGLYAIGWTILRMVNVIAPLGLDRGVIRYGVQCWRSDVRALRGVLRQSIGLAFSSGLGLACLAFLISPFLAARVFKEPNFITVMRLFALSFPLATGMTVAVAATQVTKRMKFSVYVEELYQPAVNLVFIVAFYAIGWGLGGAVLAAPLSFAVGFGIALHYIRSLFAEAFSPGLRSPWMVKDLAKFSVPTAFAGVFAHFVLYVDRLLLGYFRPAAEVGIYQAASQPSIVFLVILGSFHGIFSPMIAELYNEKEMVRLGHLFRVSTKWGLYLSLPLFLVICFLPSEIMVAVFGDEYAAGWLPLIILAVGQMINVGTGSVGQILVMTGHQNRWLMLSGLALSLNIILGLLLIPPLGLMGAAAASSTSIAGLFIGALWVVRRTLGVWPYDRRYVKGIAAAGLGAAALSVQTVLGIESPLWNLFLALTISGCVVGSALLFLGLDREDREVLHLVLSRVGLR